MKFVFLAGGVIGGYFLLLKMKGNAVAAAENQCPMLPAAQQIAGGEIHDLNSCAALNAAIAKWAWLPEPNIGL